MSFLENKPEVVANREVARFMPDHQCMFPGAPILETVNRPQFAEGGSM